LYHDFVPTVRSSYPLLSVRAALRSGVLQRKFLHTPVQELGDVEPVFARARDFVNPTELFRLDSRNRVPERKRALRRRAPELACAETYVEARRCEEQHGRTIADRKSVR